MQSAFFFLYNGTVCLAFFLMLGTVGWRSSLSFVRHIYRCSLMPCCYHEIQPSLRADRVSFILHRLALPDVQGHALPCALFETALQNCHASTKERLDAFLACANICLPLAVPSRVINSKGRRRLLHGVTRCCAARAGVHIVWTGCKGANWHRPVPGCCQADAAPQALPQLLSTTQICASQCDADKH